MDNQDVDDMIAAIYNRALADYKQAFLKLRILEKKEGKEEEKIRWEKQKEEAEQFMLTGGGYAIDPETVRKIAKCFEAFRSMTEQM